MEAISDQKLDEISRKILSDNQEKCKKLQIDWAEFFETWSSWYHLIWLVYRPRLLNAQAPHFIIIDNSFWESLDSIQKYWNSVKPFWTNNNEFNLEFEEKEREQLRLERIKFLEDFDVRVCSNKLHEQPFIWPQQESLMWAEFWTRWEKKLDHFHRAAPEVTFWNEMKRMLQSELACQRRKTAAQNASFFKHIGRKIAKFKKQAKKKKKSNELGPTRRGGAWKEDSEFCKEWYQKFGQALN